MNGTLQDGDERRRRVAELQREYAECRSDCQRLESALRESDQRFKALLYNPPEKVFHKDRNSVYVACNRNYAVEFGLDLEQMVGKTDCGLFPPEIAARYRADDQRIMASGGTEEIEEASITPAGEERLVRTVKAGQRDKRGEVVGNYPQELYIYRERHCGSSCHAASLIRGRLLGA